MGLWIKVGAVLVVVVLAVSAFFAWRGAQKQQLALQAELKTTQQALAEASAREATRDAAVKTLTAQLNQALPDVLPLPTRLAIGTERPASGRLTTLRASGRPYTGKSAAGGADDGAQKLEFPTADLK